MENSICEEELEQPGHQKVIFLLHMYIHIFYSIGIQRYLFISPTQQVPTNE